MIPDPAEPVLPDASPLVPSRLSLRALRAAATECRACDLWRTGTQTVFGEGARAARIVLVGEQPGDEEDLTGRPFVGPAGRLLDQCLAEAGVDRAAAYVTNVVKHFKWTPRGKRRLHQKPNGREVRACRPWLDAELKLLKPRVLVLLGATAAQAALGAKFRLTRTRGFTPSPLAPFVIATLHPSSVLRAPTDEDRRIAKRRLVEDLAAAAKAARTGDSAPTE